VESSVESNQPVVKSSTWSAVQVLTMATICLCLGILVGYLARGSKDPATVQTPVAATAPAETPATSAPAMPSMDQMKHMSDKAAESLLQQLQSKPNDPALLTQISKVYFSTHQFKEAISYAERAVQADPKQVGNRADLASYYYYAGDADKAIATLEGALKVQPNNPQVLFNIGMMKLKAKNDSRGAIASWNQLLNTNPTLPEEKKEAVRKAIALASDPGKDAAH
jgi:tetratricopeptide (TPR) repeat protein